MTKTIVCPECNGFGYVEECTGGLLHKNECSCCRGARTLRVIMTNADRIREMNDEELADVVECPYYGVCFEKDCHKCRLEWLQKTMEDEYEVDESKQVYIFDFTS